MRPNSRSPWVCYGLAIASVASVLLAKLAIDQTFGEGPPLILFLAAVILTAWYGGLRPALLSAALSAIVCSLLFFPPYRSLWDHSPGDNVRLGVFLAESLLIGVLMEQLHAARRRAEAADLAKGHFLALLSHELRTPLNPVLMAVSALLEDSKTPPGARANLELIRRNVLLEARLIDDLLDINRVIRGKMPYRWEVVDAHVLVRRAVDICIGEVKAKQISLTTDLSAAAHHVRADPARLQQVFWNLIQNATKFTPQGGAIAIASRDGPDGRLVVEVSDSGEGIDVGAQGKIFAPYEQGHDGVTRRHGGLGLGLAISRSIVEAHGGTIAAASGGKGLGANFTIGLPTVPTPAADECASPPSPAVARQGRELRILLVEDDPATARLMAGLLRQKGYAVATAGGVAEALEVADDEFDLVLSDIHLPDGSGLDLMRRLRARHGIAGIALTGYGMEDDRERSRQAGFVAHLTKPVDIPELDRTIRRVASSPIART